MADFMKQGVNMFIAGFAGIDQNPLLARKELAVNIIAEIVNEFHLDAKVLGHAPQRVFNLVLHLPLVFFLFFTN